MDHMQVFVDIKCPVCHSESYKKKYTIKYYSHKVPEKLGINKPYPVPTLRTCSTCSHNYASPVISDSSLSFYYSKLNSHFYSNQILPDKDPREEFHKRLYREVMKYKKRGSVLEIGCGYGYLLSQFKQHGWEVQGIEPSAHASQIARELNNINVHSGFIDDFKQEKESFDVILLFDVLEHIHDAKHLLSKALHFLKPGGIIVFGTGNIKSTNAAINRQTWGYFSTWEHLSFFSKESTSYLFRTNGIKLLKIKKYSHRGSTFSNVLKYVKNLVIYRPFNIATPGLLQVAPQLKRAFPNNNFVKNGVGFSELCFDHILAIGRRE